MITKYLTDSIWTDHPVRAQSLVGRKEVYLAEEVEQRDKEIRLVLGHSLEYWNGNMNDRAMLDALEAYEKAVQHVLANLKEPT